MIEGGNFARILDGFAQLESVVRNDDSEKGLARFGVSPFTRLELILTEKK